MSSVADRVRRAGPMAIGRGFVVRAQLACLLVALLLHSPSVGAQANSQSDPGTLQGRIIDERSRGGVDRAFIVLLRGADTAGVAYTDSVGAFRFSVAGSGSFSLLVRRLGYSPQRFAVEWTHSAIPLDLALVPIPRTIGEVAVTAPAATSARVAGFEERMSRHGGGTFINRQKLDAWHSMRMSDVMRRVSGVKLIDSSGVLLVASTRGYKVNLMKSDFMAPCILRVGIDGQVKEWGFPVNSIDPDQIHGVEVYNGPATIPPEFNALRTDAQCGLVMIWTRAGSSR